MSQLQRYLPILFILAGLSSIASQWTSIRDHLRYAQWIPVRAVVESAHVIGQRAFRPEVVLRYRVGDSSFVLTSFMDVPGFGSKRNRLDVAERIVAKLAVGDSVTVFYDPNRPSDARVHRRLSYSNYLIVTTGLCFLVLGLVLGQRWWRRPS